MQKNSVGCLQKNLLKKTGISTGILNRYLNQNDDQALKYYLPSVSLLKMTF